MTTIVLIGPPGAGKSAVGERVAAALGHRFIDVDESIATVTGRTPAEILAADGESRFRALEHSALLEALEVADAVIALGAGGTSHRGCADALTDALVLLLDVSPEVATARLGEAGVERRPLLDEHAPLVSYRELELARAKTRWGLADLVLATDNVGLDDVVARVRDNYERIAERRERLETRASAGG